MVKHVWVRKLTSSGRWQVRWEEDGRRRARNFSRRSDAQAEAIRLKSGDPSAVVGGRTFERFAEDYLAWKVTRYPERVSQDRAMLEQHVYPVIGDHRLAELKPFDGERLVMSLVGKPSARYGRPLQPKTVNNILTLVKAALNRAVAWEILPRNPFRDVAKIKVQTETVRFWTPMQRDEFYRIVAQTDKEFADSVLFACMTGLRLGEQQDLRRDCLDFDEGLIRVSSSYNAKTKESRGYTKTKQVRYVPMSATVRRICEERRFREFTFGPLREMTNHVRALARRTPPTVPKIRWHDLRHTAASHLAMANLPLQVIAELCGHRNMQTTQRYAHLSPQFLREAVDKLDRITHLGDSLGDSIRAEGAQATEVKG